MFVLERKSIQQKMLLVALFVFLVHHQTIDAGGH